MQQLEGVQAREARCDTRIGMRAGHKRYRAWGRARTTTLLGAGASMEPSGLWILQAPCGHVWCRHGPSARPTTCRLLPLPPPYTHSPPAPPRSPASCPHNPSHLIAPPPARSLLSLSIAPRPLLLLLLLLLHLLPCSSSVPISAQALEFIAGRPCLQAIFLHNICVADSLQF